MVTTKWALALAVVVAGATVAGCDNRECDDKFDCPLAQFCSVDGMCTADESTTIAGDTAVFLRTRDGARSAVIEFTPQGQDVPATLNGNIASASGSGSARGQASMLNPGRVNLVVTHPTLSSTFMALFQLPAELLGQPGDHRIGAPSDVTSPVAQACNYDTTEYDEQITDVVIHVPAPVDGAPTLPVGIEFHSPQTDARATAEVPLRW